MLYTHFLGHCNPFGSECVDVRIAYAASPQKWQKTGDVL